MSNINIAQSVVNSIDVRDAMAVNKNIYQAEENEYNLK